MSKPGATMMSGGYHEYSGRFQYTGGYHEYTRGCSVHRGISVRMRKNRDQISRIFVLAPFATMQLYMLASGTSDSLLKFVHQVARAQTLTHYLFYL